MVSSRYRCGSNEKLSGKHLKYPYQRVEQRHNHVDKIGLRERKAMEVQANRISIGTLNIFKPSPDTRVSYFTLALAKPIPKYELYRVLKEVFGDDYDCSVRSVSVSLKRKIRVQDLNDVLKARFQDTSFEVTP